MPEKVTTPDPSSVTKVAPEVETAEKVVEEKADSGVDQPATPEAEDPSGILHEIFLLNRGFIIIAGVY